MTSRSPRVAIAGAFLLGTVFGGLSLGLIRHSSTGVAHAQAVACTNATFSGAYGVKVSGVALVAPDGTPLPSPLRIDSIGAVTADGAGNATAVETVDRAGTVASSTETGTYSVNANCTFTMTAAVSFPKAALTVHLVGVLVDGGKRAYLIDDDSGVADVQITFEQQ